VLRTFPADEILIAGDDGAAEVEQAPRRFELPIDRLELPR
jgi:hypothetical protein